MKKTLIILGSVIIFFGLAYVAFFLYINSRTAPANIGNGPDVKNISYLVGNEGFTLINGRSEKPIVDSTAKNTLTMFGEPVYGDLNGDGLEDAAVLLVNDSSGSGTFYYATLAIKNNDNSYKATNALLLGDRIAPQTVEIHDGQAVYNYADRNANEPMTAQPSVGKSFYIQYDKNSGQISELIKTTIMTEIQAKVIAENTCIKGGESLAPGYYNEGTKTWWFDANLNATRESCNPACVVSEDTKTAEINWRCTGLIKPGVNCPMDAKLCPDGSYVVRGGSNCEFALCP